MRIISADEISKVMNDTMRPYQRKIRYVTELPQIQKEVENPIKAVDREEEK